MPQVIHLLIFLFISVVLYWVIPKKWRCIFLFVASTYFMFLFSAKYTLYFILNAILIYFAGKRMQQSRDKNKIILKSSLIWLIGNLCFFKYNHLFLDLVGKLDVQNQWIDETAFARIAVPLGMSYIIFRLIHYAVELYRKNLPEHSFWDLALYVFFFPTFIAGPVDRFQRFHPQTAEQKSLDIADINSGLLRIIGGLVKKFVIAGYLSPLVMPVLTAPEGYSRLILILSIYGLAIQIYMDFSGYTDMALGIARLFGYKIMENFNYPYLKKNIALFWRNWHMSVYSFIRDYFFFPFFGHRATQLKIYIGIFITMIVFMIWHEGSIPFLLLGIYHGAGLVIWQVFQEIKRKNPKLRRIVDNPVFDPFSIFLTFSFVSFGFIIFSFDLNTISAVIRELF